ncbi:MAG: class B sortase [Anaerofustis sp.]
MQQKKKKIYNLLLLTFVALFIVSAYFLASDLIPRTKAADEIKMIQQESPASEPCDEQPSIASLKQINPDIVGWIRIENTDIDFPLLQCSNNSYYLTHTYTEEYNDAGSIFLDCGNSPYFTDQNTVIYGHARKDGTMFAQLKKYKKQSGYEESPVITIMIEDNIYYYQVFSVNIVDASYDYRSSEYADFSSYVRKMRNTSLIDSDAVVTDKSRIITLSTCSAEIEDGRLAVLAVLMNPNGEETD